MSKKEKSEGVNEHMKDSFKNKNAMSTTLDFNKIEKDYFDLLDDIIVGYKVIIDLIQNGWYGYLSSNDKSRLYDWKKDDEALRADVSKKAAGVAGDIIGECYCTGFKEGRVAGERDIIDMMKKAVESGKVTTPEQMLRLVEFASKVSEGIFQKETEGRPLFVQFVDKDDDEEDDFDDLEIVDIDSEGEE